MTEVRQVSPFLNIGGQILDVRKLVDTVEIGSFITEMQIGTSALPIPDLPKDININSQEREAIFRLMHHFLYLKFTPTPNDGSGPNFAYKAVSRHQPEEMVMIQKTDDRIGLTSRIIPKELLSEPGQLDPDWMKIATFALIDQINQHAG